MTIADKIVEKLHVDDFPTDFILTIVDAETCLAIDISSMTTLQVKYYKPDGTVVTKTAVFLTDGTDGKIVYTTVTGDIDQVGMWSYRGAVAKVGPPAASYQSSTEEIKVWSKW